MGADRDVEHTAVGLVGVLLKTDDCIGLGGSRLAQRVVGVARLDERGQILCGIIDAAATDRGEEVVLPAVLVAEVGVEPEPLEHVVGDVEGTCQVALAALLDDTLLVVVGNTGIELRLAPETVNRQGIALVRSYPADVLDPVGAFPVGERSLDGQAAQRSGHIHIGGSADVLEVFVAVDTVLLGVHQVKVARKHRETGRRLEIDGDIGPGIGGVGAALGGYDDDAVGAAGAVDGRRRSILQDRDGLDVGRVDVAEGSDRIHNTVDHDQRIVGSGDGTGTADTDHGVGAGLTVGGGDFHTGHTALKGLVYGQNRLIADIGHLDVGDGSRKVGLLHGAVADDDSLFKHLVGVGRHSDVDALAALHGEDVFGIAEEVDGQVVAVFALYGVTTRHIRRRRSGHGTFRSAAFYYHDGAGEGLRVFIAHDTRNLAGLG